MPCLPPLRAGIGLLVFALGACASAPPPPPPLDHPANLRAPAAPAESEPSALATYRDFHAARPAAPPDKDSAMDHSQHSMPEHNDPETSNSQQPEQEQRHEHHQ
jgi:hypothetical protein